MIFTSYLKKNKWLFITAFVLIIFMRLFAQNEYLVEKIYTGRFYYFFSRILRTLFGWMPFSIGDILYFVTACWLLWKISKNIFLLFRKQYTMPVFLKKLVSVVLICMAIYIIFNIFWGLNYNRKGIAWQLHLTETAYNTESLKTVNEILLQKVNAYKKALVAAKANYPNNKSLFDRAIECYGTAKNVYPFLVYKSSSVKSSLYGWLGNYLGFTGYYNPFTGEAQVNTTVPKFLLPYIALHEMGHQLGYAKEDEANFVAYLAGKNSTDTLFKYSTYLDLFVYANREIFYFDSALSKKYRAQLIPEVKNDLLEWRRFNEVHTSFIEPAISWLYGKYLIVNQQPKGLRSYNEVIVMLLAFYKKYSTI